MGSRYGSLKQMDGVGPNNEAIIDYSVYDAIRAGFGLVVFAIRHSFGKRSSMRVFWRSVQAASPWVRVPELDYAWPQGGCCSPKGASSVGAPTTP